MLHHHILSSRGKTQGHQSSLAVPLRTFLTITTLTPGNRKPPPKPTHAVDFTQTQEKTNKRNDALKRDLL
ncbi:hypothetical protein E2C01_019083 [Portunus trituberculatus]|uniref:Uncharacterized protein n=1 Tax=Portunus trituberculatus TaxID=210409 RepID=A0A5B7DXX7_PORTR|nr:hypothetical protein [Portunus trituberculatus]